MLVCKILVLLSSVVAARLICLILYLSIFLLVNYLASRDRLSLLFAFKNYGYQVGSGFFSKIRSGSGLVPPEFATMVH